MNYAEMSDFEINCRVHFSDCTNLIYEKGIFKYTRKSGMGGSVGRRLYKIHNPDYCNSWADAGPIIEENEIGLVKCTSGWCATSDYSHLEGLYHVNKSPTRAAMIAFLMMKDKEVKNESH